MSTKPYFAFAALTAAVMAGGAFAETMTTVKCDGINVMLTEEQAAAIKAKTGDADFGPKVCEAAMKIDASSFAEPTAVTVTMSDGSAYDMKLEATK